MTHGTLQAQYQKEVDAGTMQLDPAQQSALMKLQRVHDELTQRWRRHRLHQLWHRRRKHPHPVRGVYLWGGVGVGKTYMMDIFFQSLPSSRKMRMHFHQFMRQIHQQLKALQGTEDPLKVIAKKLQATTDILCFDEFFVKDIADAMILRQLLTALFERGITLVATSNVVPDQLYLTGLQRDLFVPAIHLLQQHTEVFHVAALKDYRLRELTKAGVYFTPPSETQMEHMFHSLVHGTPPIKKPLCIEGRQISVIARASSVIWFHFSALCHVPRSQMDYLEIASDYDTVLVSGVPKIASREDALITYFIYLVDIFYDAHVRLILSADTEIPQIYESGRLAFEFERTKSRLFEMQTDEYLSRPHRPPV
jgi:cell division protein ZapE